jgi:aspartate/methionine/tyrosine aminotransferase
LRGDQSGAQKIIDTLRERRDVLADALCAIKGVTVYKPEVTFYLFPDVTEVYNRMGIEDRQAFRLDALYKTGVSFCSRSHFGKPLPDEDRTFIRFAYSGIDVSRIKDGLARLKAYWEK